MRYGPRIIFRAISVLALMVAATPAEALVTGDASGIGTTVTNTTIAGIPTELIGGGKAASPNLFHSFGDFSISAGNMAAFTQPAGVTRIIGRVTGGNLSHIDGRILSISDLFLFNPAGVYIGPNAVLSVSGAFHVAAADYVRLADGARFDGHDTSWDATLTAAPPEAFGFLDAPPAGVQIDGARLAVPKDQTLTVAGGSVEMAGGLLWAPGGRVNVIGMGQAGEMPVEGGNLPAGYFGPADPGEPEGRVVLRDGALVTATPDPADLGTEPAGEIHIRAGNFLVTGSGVTGGVAVDSSVTNPTGDLHGGGVDVSVDNTLSVTDNGLIGTESSGDGNGGGINLGADEIAIGSGGSVRAEAKAAGRGGNIGIVARRMSVTDGGVVSTDNYDTGAGGSIRIESEELLEVGGASRISANALLADEGGPAGSITVRVLPDTDPLSPRRGLGQVILTDNGQMSCGTLGSGAGGDLSIETDLLTMDRGYLSSSTGGPGPGGEVRIVAYSGIDIAGSPTAERGVYGDYFGIYAQTTAKGNGGSITIYTPQLRLAWDAFINGQTYGSGRGGNVRMDVDRLEVLTGGTITTSTRGAGPSGDIAIDAAESIYVAGYGPGKVGVENSWIFSATHSAGAGGSIDIRTPELILADRGVIFASSLGDDTRDGNTLPSGNAGSIRLEVDRLEMSDGGAVIAGTKTSGSGGSISVSAAESVRMIGSGASNRLGVAHSGIYARTEASGPGGSIRISTPVLEISRSAGISTSSSAHGRGGEIGISTGELNMSQSAQISSAAGGAGFGGSIALDLNRLYMEAASTISARSTGSGDAGEISIKAADRIQLADSAITTEALNADGGNIDIQADYMLYLLRSDLTATVAGGMGNGGNITIDPQFVILNKSRVIANAFGGRGGNIDITAGFYIPSADSVVSASSAFGVDGTVYIDAPDLDISGNIAVLPETFLDATGLLSDRCAVRTRETASSLVVTGRGGLPATPDDCLPGTLTVDPALEEERDRKKAPSTKP